ncbi:MAG: hypothetical protein JWO79_2980 [Actinomycetia bacterium]|nr:hypothetical protein [Actinomycetes bacterium]
MIVCAKCGNANSQSDEFCGSCGAFLEWHGERLGPDPVPEPTPEPVAAPEKFGFIDRVKYVVGMEEGPAAPVIQTAGLAGSPLTSAVSAPPPVIGAVAPPVSGPAGYGTPQVGPYPVTSPLDAPLPPQAPTYGRASVPMAPLGSVGLPPAPPPLAQPVVTPPVVNPDPSLGGRLPGQEYERPTAHRPDAADLGPADLYCGTCGAGNLTGRRFCRRCGTSLADAVVVKRSWWQRMFGRKRRSLGAGERPDKWKKLSVPSADSGSGSAAGSGSGSGSGSKKKWRMPKLPSRLPIGKFAPILIVLGLLGMGLGPARAKVTLWAFGAVNQAKQLVHPDYQPLTPASATASDAAPGHPALHAVDKVLNTYWAEGRAGTGTGASLTVTFDGSQTVKQLSIRNGAEGKDFAAQPRLKDIEISLFDKDRTRVGKQEITVADNDTQQNFDLSADDVASATVKIVSVYPGQRGQAASVREITFYKLK